MWECDGRIKVIKGNDFKALKLCLISLKIVKIE